MGGGPDKERFKLAGGVNRERDVSEPRNNYQPLRLPQNSTEDEAIQSLLSAVDDYNAKPPVKYTYNPFPKVGCGAYNSNGFVSGILDALGFGLPFSTGVNAPGFDIPVPRGYFHKVPPGVFPSNRVRE